MVSKLDSLLTVSQLNRYVKSVLDGDFRLRDLYLRGEISNFTNHYRSGHFYFTLKEGNCAVKAVMFANYANNLLFEPENGMAVILRCSVSLYERDGSYQIYVYDMQPDGKGVLQVAFEQLYRKLEAKGLFDPLKKKLIPQYAQRIGVVTSETGAALQDIINVLSRRCPMAELVLAPALVQGEDAPFSLIRSLKMLDEHGDCDVIIIGRGGGSMEDLWGFNDERLVMQVAACKTPIISAVGHETDFTLCDYAADLRAPTPSAAAELASMNQQEVMAALANLSGRISSAVMHDIEFYRHRLQNLKEKPCFLNPDRELKKYTKNLDYLAESIQIAWKNGIMRRQERLKMQAAQLEALNPLARLAGGYSVTTKNGEILSSVRKVKEGDPLQIRLADGTLDARVTKVSLMEESDLWQKN